jgi:arylsulfatase A-like enzyme
MKSTCLPFVAAMWLAVAVTAHADLASIIAEVESNSPAQPGAIPRRASIIFIQCHGLGYGDLSCDGQTNYQTPNLDRLAAEGIRFTNYRAGSTDFTAAQAVLMAGKNSTDATPGPGAPTIAQRLQQAGYRTGLLGEWALGPTPWTQGFDEFAGFVQADEGRNYFADYLWRYAPDSILNVTNNQTEAFVGKEMIYPNTGGKNGEYLPEMFTKMMVNFIHTHQPDRFNHYQPFFLLVDLPAPRSASATADDFPVPTDAPFSDAPWPPAAKNRAALITRLDTGIGRLFEELQKMQLTNNVAIFFTSASGAEKFVKPQLKALWPADDIAAGSPRVPMLVRWPGNIPAGRVSRQAWSAVDFAPTALQIGFAKPAADFTGISVLPVLFGQAGTTTNVAPDRLDRPIHGF